MGDLRYLKAGEKIETFPGETWNRHNDATRIVEQAVEPGAVPFPLASPGSSRGLVTVQAALRDGDVGGGEAVQIVGPLMSPAAAIIDENRAISRTQLEVTANLVADKPALIALEAVKQNDVGTFTLMGGPVWARVNTISGVDDTAIVEADTGDNLLRSTIGGDVTILWQPGSGGPQWALVMLTGQISSARVTAQTGSEVTEPGSTVLVNVWDNGKFHGRPIEAQYSIHATANLAPNSLVWITRRNGSAFWVFDQWLCSDEV